jgi:hypothetical protein
VQISQKEGVCFGKRRKLQDPGQEDETAIQVYVTVCLGKKESERYSYKKKQWVWLRILQHHYYLLPKGRRMVPLIIDKELWGSVCVWDGGVFGGRVGLSPRENLLLLPASRFFLNLIY